MIFGKFDIVEDYILINHILLIAKYYIYFRKCHNSVPSIRGFIAKAGRVFNIELHIAREKSRLLFHFRKWEKLTNALTALKIVVDAQRFVKISRHLYCYRGCCNIYMYFSLLLLSFFFFLLG